VADICKDYLSHPKAIQACKFFESLTLIGDYSGEQWRLEDFQRDWISELYGTRNEDGSRQKSTVSLWMPRGLGKTQQAAGVALYELCMGQDGREVYAAAPDREKAGRIYKAMAQMIRANPFLDDLCMCSDHYMRIKIPSKHSTFQSLAANEGQGNSLAPSTLVCDEMHLWRSRDLYDALVSGGHKRKEGSFLQIQISTAGNTKSGLAWELYSYAKKVRDGEIINPNYLVRIFETPEEADWTSEEVWRQAMPCSYVNFKTISQECEVAKHIKHKEFSFRQLYLGHWLEHADRTWLDLEEWRACADAYTEDDLIEEPAIMSLDMSRVTDLTSIVLYFPQSKRLLTWSFLPSEDIAKREEKDKVPYRTWAKPENGYLILTKGKKINHEEVAEKINELLGRFDVEQFVADPALLSLICPYLDRQPETYKQTYEYLNPPCQKLELLISNKQIRHSNNPLLNWCVGNVVVIPDKQERIFPSKKRSRGRIDPVVALLMAIGVSMGDEPEQDINKLWANVENYQIDLSPETKRQS
jgi:Phage terminase-like protein, large subunit